MVVRYHPSHATHVPPYHSARIFCWGRQGGWWEGGGGGREGWEGERMGAVMLRSTDVFGLLFGEI